MRTTMEPDANLDAATNELINKVVDLLSMGSKNKFKIAKRLWTAANPRAIPGVRSGLLRARSGREVVATEYYALTAIDTLLVELGVIKPTKYQLRVALGKKYYMVTETAVSRLPDSLFTLEKCANCHAPEARDCLLSCCQYCETTFYCGRDCQREHWKSTHRKLCKKKQKAPGGG